MRANSFDYRAPPDDSTKIQQNFNTSLNEEGDDNLLELLQGNNDPFCSSQQPESFCLEKKSSQRWDKTDNSGSPGQKRCPYCQRIFQLERYDIHRKICEQAHIINQAGKQRSSGRKPPERKSSAKKPPTQNAREQPPQTFDRLKEKGRYKLYSPAYYYTFDF